MSRVPKSSIKAMCVTEIITSFNNSLTAFSLTEIGFGRQMDTGAFYS